MILEFGEVISEEIFLTSLDALREKENIVWTNGCFDLLHPGHFESFERAKDEGAILIVGVNSDESMRKIKREPIHNEKDRAYMVSCIRPVNYVVIFDELEPSKWVAKIKPNICCKGEDWRDKPIPERKVVESYGGEFVFLPTKEGYSTTKIIERCKNDPRA